MVIIVVGLMSIALAGCAKRAAPAKPSEFPPESAGADDASADDLTPGSDGEDDGAAAALDCEEGDPLTVTFYEAGQALSALVTLPDGRHILVDAGESPKRPGCGAPCKAWHNTVVKGLRKDLGDDPIEMLWITHQHSDHHGGVEGIAGANVRITTYVDNGQDPSKAGVKKARAAAQGAGATLHEIGPGNTALPIAGDERVQLSAVVPDAWPGDCAKDPNDCSIGLLVEYCRSSILFTGDAELAAESAWPVGDITLLQVGHHGSDTSSGQSFVAKVKPEYAVVSCAKRDDGTNKGYCHPRQSTVDRLTAALGGAGASSIETFDAAVKCKDAGKANWHQTPASDNLWITARDGTVRLTTSGDGVFAEVP
jgi:competence protein ComEC